MGDEHPLLAQLLGRIDDHRVALDESGPGPNPHNPRAALFVLRFHLPVLPDGHRVSALHRERPSTVERRPRHDVTATTYGDPMSFDRPLPTALSPSRLQDFRACPRRFQYSAVERIPQPATYATTKGRLVHWVLEQLYRMDAGERTEAAAHGFIEPAEAEILTESVRDDLAVDDELLARLRHEVQRIIDVYFTMEDPRLVSHVGVELRVNVELEGVPMLGILDRLDRRDDGALVIVDYKTGSLPNRNYDTQTFANAELYAALCETSMGELPKTIELLYVAQGETIERHVTEVVVRARAQSAADAWASIERFHSEGAFPATPSVNTCRFCSYADRCRASGVAVPVRTRS